MRRCVGQEAPRSEVRRPTRIVIVGDEFNSKLSVLWYQVNKEHDHDAFVRPTHLKRDIRRASHVTLCHEAQISIRWQEEADTGKLSSAALCALPPTTMGQARCRHCAAQRPIGGQAPTAVDAASSTSSAPARRPCRFDP
jgi:hypothetical protein